MSFNLAMQNYMTFFLSKFNYKRQIW